MKKRLLPLLLTLVLVLGVSVVGAQADETPETTPAKQTWSHLTISEDGLTAVGYCPHCCDDPSQTVEWTLYTRTSGHNYLTTDGHYFLNASTSSNGAIRANVSGLDFVLHLNGHTYERYSKDGNTTGVLFPNKTNTTISIVDDQEQKGALSGQNGGWVVNNNGKTGTKVVLYSGNLTTKVTTIATSGTNVNGGTIYMTTGTFEMYGGTVNGTKAVSGGAIYASGSSTSVKIHGGTVSGGSATSYGGNIYSEGATVLVDGGIISGGTTAKCGGNIFHSDGNGITINGGTVTGGIADDRGGNIYISAVASNLTITGGTVSDGQALAKGTSDLTGGGGNIYVNHGKMDIYGGTISGGQAKLGGNICTNIGSNASDKTAFIGDDNDATTPAPVISGGYASSNGGNIYAAEALEIGVCTIKEGDADSKGGNIYAAKALTVGVATISGGEAASSGGNIYAAKALTVGAATISDGEAASGGNIICNGATTLTGTTMTGGQATYGGSLYVSGSGDATVNANISGGTATDRGGNIYMSSVTGKLTITGGTIEDGVCTGNDSSAISGGGNIYTNNGVFTLTGGVIRGGKAPRGGNLYTNTGANDDTNYTILNGSAVLKDGEATYGGNLYLSNTMTLGAVTFQNGTGTYGSDIYVAEAANLTMDTSFSGEAKVYYAMNQLPYPIPGGMIAANKNKAADAGIEINRANGVFTGKLYLENDASLPYIYAKENDDKLYVTGVALIDKDGNYTWFINNADAAAAYTADTAYMQVVDGALPLGGGNYVIDLCGSDVQITGSGNVTVFDSANDDYKTYGTATIDGPTLQNAFKTNVDGKDTYTVETEGVYSFHRLGVKIVGVSVRPSAAGMYYTGIWQCDELLAEKVETFGVAVSIRNQPGLDFATDKDSLYTEFGKEDFVSGVAKTGVLIENIVKGSTKQNTLRSKKDIYATAYVTFAEGTIAISGEDVAYSLYNTMEIVEENIYDYAAKADELQAFCDTWAAAGVAWDMNFELSADEKQLHTVYSNRTAYHGEAHDHGATGGNSDGNYTLGQWEMGMEELDMDFATLVDHRQVNHMYLPEWNTDKFIGGSEASTLVQGEGYVTDHNKMHYNMIFTDPKGLEAVVSSFAPFNYRYSSSKGIYEFSYPNLTPDQIREVIQLVKDNGGMFTHVHPKSSSYIQSDDPLMYWFADWTGLEVFYGYGGYAPERSVNEQNYQLWVDLLAAGKKIWATAGSDKHAAANTDALTTIYSEKADAETYFSHMKVGDTTCGPVGIRMCVGDTLMGSETDFAGKRLVFCVDDFHARAYDETHTYHVELISDTGVVYSAEFDVTQPFYYGMDADDTAKFYRVEVFDDTLGLRIAIGNPIWNQ